MSANLPPSVAAYFAGSNALDPAACAACFAADAIVLDEGRERRGVADIRTWKTEVMEKYRATADVTNVAETEGRTVVTARVSGDFPGSPVNLRYAFTLAGEKIARLEIVP